MINPESSIKSLSKIGPKYQKILEKLGVFTIYDFLFYFPFRYDDFSKTTVATKENLNQVVTIEGKIEKTKNNKIFKKRLTITEIIIRDENDTPIKAVWFNQPFILEKLKEGEKARLSGKLTLNGKNFIFNNPAWEISYKEKTNTGCLVPIYSETVGITSKWIRWQIKNLLPIAKKIPDKLPDEIRKKYKLYSISSTLKQIHFPESIEKLVLAQKRIAFEEIFLAQLKSLKVKKDLEKTSSIKIEIPADC